MRQFLRSAFLMIFAIQLAVLSPAQAAENACHALFMPVGKTAHALERFDHDLFADEKSRFLADPESSLKPEDRPETILAWIEARSEKQGFSFQVSRDPVALEKRAASWKKALIAQKWRSRDYKSSGARLRTALMMMHAELHAYGWKDLPRSFLPNAQTAISERVQSEILAGELVSAFAKSGFVIDPLHAERLSHRLYASGGWNWALQLSLSAFSPVWTKMLIPPELGGGSFLPPLISGAKFEYLRKLPPELEEKIKTQGYAAAKEDLMRHFGLPAHASWVVNTASRIFVYACLAILLENAWEYYPWMESFVKSVLLESDESIHDARVEMGADAIREQLVASWQEWYEATYHRAPEPLELEKARARMQAIPDDKLLGAPATKTGSKTGSEKP